MKLLPYFLEDEGARFSGAISLASNTDVLAEEEAIRIANYMESCLVIDDWLSNVADALTNKLEVPAKMWSDGTYVWDSRHSHYVRRYAARLPEDFVNHVKSQLASGFDPASLNSAELSAKFELLLEKVAEGDETIFDGSFSIED